MEERILVAENPSKLYLGIVSKYLILLKLIDLVVCVSFQQSMQLLLSSMLIISPYLQPILILSRIKHFHKADRRFRLI